MPESLFSKVTSLQPATLQKRDSGVGIFMLILQNFLEHLLHLQMPASETSIKSKVLLK